MTLQDDVCPAVAFRLREGRLVRVVRVLDVGLHLDPRRVDEAHHRIVRVEHPDHHDDGALSVWM